MAIKASRYKNESSRKIEKALGEEKLGFVSKEEEVIAKKLRSHIK